MILRSLATLFLCACVATAAPTGPVTDLTIVYDVQTGEVLLQWSPVLGAGNYRVYVRPMDGDPPTLWSETNGDTSYLYQPSSGAGTLFYHVSAMSSGDQLESAPSNVVGYVARIASPSVNPFGLPFKFWQHPSGQTPTYGTETFRPSGILSDQCNCGSPTTADLIVRQDNGLLAWRDSASNCDWKGSLEENAAMIPGKAYWYLNRSGVSRQYVLCGETDHNGNYGSVLITAAIGSYSYAPYVPYSWRDSRVIPRDQLQLLECGFTGGTIGSADRVMRQGGDYFYYRTTGSPGWTGMLTAVGPGEAYWLANRHVGHDWTYTYTGSGAALSMPGRGDKPQPQAVVPGNHESSR